MGETDPNDPIDDVECETDSDCGDMTSGRVCVDGACTPGCRGADGNSCPDGQMCTSTGSEAGVCEEFERYAGGGCACRVGEREDANDTSLSSVALIALALAFATRKRSSRREQRD
jgi:hypothetical protein